MLGDDDAVRPTHTEHLLAAAREHRYEQCYGLQVVHFAAGETLTLGSFPPTLGQWALQAAIFHAGLRFFESELADSIFHEPNDWAICRRMMRAGVRIGMIDEVVADKHERRRARSRGSAGTTAVSGSAGVGVCGTALGCRRRHGGRRARDRDGTRAAGRGL